MREREKIKRISKEVREEEKEDSLSKKDKGKKTLGKNLVEFDRYFFTFKALQLEIKRISSELPRRSSIKTSSAKFDLTVIKVPSFEFKESVSTLLPEVAEIEHKSAFFDAEVLLEEFPRILFKRVALKLPKIEEKESSLASGFDRLIFLRHVLEKDMYREVSLEMGSQFEEDLLRESGKGLLEELLGIIEEEELGRRIPRGLSETGNMPIVVYLEDPNEKYVFPVIHILHALLKEICQVIPKVTYRKASKEEDIDGIEVENLRDFRLANKLEAVNFLSASHMVSEFFDEVYGRLGTAFTEGFGILLMISDNVKSLREKIPIKGVLEYELHPKKENLKGYIFALLGVPEEDFFAALRRREKELKKISRRYSFFVARQMSEEGFVDREQYRWKVLAFYLILKELSKDQKREVKRLSRETVAWILRLLRDRTIAIEEEIPGGTGAIPDIRIKWKGRETFVEIETLMGTGEPMKKIDETVEKYLKKDLLNNNKNLWIILRPESALLHYAELKFRKEVWSKFEEINVEIKVPVFIDNEWKVLSLEEYYKRIKKLLEK